MYRRNYPEPSIADMERAVNEARIAAADARVSTTYSNLQLAKVRNAVDSAKKAVATANAIANTNTIANVRPTRKSDDSVVNAIVDKFLQRSNLGIQKYGTTLDRKDLDMMAWIVHVQEELMDAILYLEKLKEFTR